MSASSSSSQAAARASTRRRGQRVHDTDEDVVVVQDHEGHPGALVPARGIGGTTSLSQVKAAMNVNPALLVALKAVDEMKTTLLRHSYAVMTIDDAGLRNAITFTATEAQGWFSGTSDAEKRAIQQVAATGGTVNDAGNRLPKHGYTCVRSYDGRVNKEALDICWEGGRIAQQATVTILPPSQDRQPAFSRASKGKYRAGYKTLEEIAEQTLRTAAVAVGLEAQDLTPLLATTGSLGQGAFLSFLSILFLSTLTRLFQQNSNPPQAKLLLPTYRC